MPQGIKLHWLKIYAHFDVTRLSVVYHVHTRKQMQIFSFLEIESIFYVTSYDQQEKQRGFFLRKLLQ